MTTTENLPPIPEDEGIQDLLQLNRLLEITADSPVQLRDRYVDTQTDPGIMVADFMGNAEAVGGVKHRIAEETLLLRENLATRNVTGAKADAIVRSGLVDLRVMLHQHSQQAKPRILRYRRGFTEMGGDEGRELTDGLLSVMGVALFDGQPKAVPRNDARARQIWHVAKWMDPAWAEFVSLNPGHANERDLQELTERYGPRNPKVVDFLLRLNNPGRR